MGNYTIITKLQVLSSLCYNYLMSLTRDDLADIKQLMETTIGNALTVALTEQDGRLNKRFDKIDQRMDNFGEIQNETLNAIGIELNDTAETLSTHDKRITKLEKAVL